MLQKCTSEICSIEAFQRVLKYSVYIYMHLQSFNIRNMWSKYNLKCSFKGWQYMKLSRGSQSCFWRSTILQPESNTTKPSKAAVTLEFELVKSCCTALRTVAGLNKMVRHLKKPVIGPCVKFLFRGHVLILKWSHIIK